MGNYAVIENEDLKPQTNDNIVNLTLQTLSLNKQVLVFNNSKRSSEKTADSISDNVLSVKHPEELRKLANKILKALSVPTKQCRRLAKNVEKGVAFHHSGLITKQRTLIENGFKEGFIKVISSTPTLAAGLNLPAYKVIIKDYKRYSQRGMADIPILEYHQMAGRAGRPGIETVGKTVLCVKSDQELHKVIPKYLFGKPEEIISKLAVEPTLKMYILSLVAMDLINEKNEIKEFFSNTFYAHQYKDLDSLNYNLFRILGILKEYDFITQDDDYYMVTTIGKKVSQLYLNPDTADYFHSNIDKIIENFSNKTSEKKNIFALIYFICGSMEMRPLFNVPKIDEAHFISRAEDIEEDLILPFDPFERDYSEFLKIIKVSDILIDWISEAPEDYICDRYKITPGELKYKIDIIDWLLYCVEEISVLNKSFFLKNILTRLRTRFKFGIKAEILGLITLSGVGRVRARKLYNGGFRTLYDLKKGDFTSISRLIGEKITIKIKNQVNENLNNSSDSILDVPKRPKEIVQREVTDDEIEHLVTNYSKYEREKEESQRKLTSFF